MRLSVLFLAAVVTAACGGFRLTATGQISATVDAWAGFSAATGGIALTSQGSADVPDLVLHVVREGVEPGDAVDLVFVVDTTASMEDDVDAVRARIREILGGLAARNPDRQVGIVAYRDLGDDYVSVVTLPLSDDDEQIIRGIDALMVEGGGDIREHVYAGLDTALRDQPWRSGTRHHLVLMGDAPPHDDYADDPRTRESVLALAARPDLAVRIHTIGISCDPICRGLIAAGL